MSHTLSKEVLPSGHVAACSYRKHVTLALAVLSGFQLLSVRQLASEVEGIQAKAFSRQGTWHRNRAEGCPPVFQGDLL